MRIEVSHVRITDGRRSPLGRGDEITEAAARMWVDNGLFWFQIKGRDTRGNPHPVKFCSLSGLEMTPRDQAAFSGEEKGKK